MSQRPESEWVERGPERRVVDKRPVHGYKRSGEDRRQPVSTQREDALEALDKIQENAHLWGEKGIAWFDCVRAALRALPTEPVQQGERIEGWVPSWHLPYTPDNRIAEFWYSLPDDCPWDDGWVPATLILHTPPVSEPTKEGA